MNLKEFQELPVRTILEVMDNQGNIDYIEIKISKNRTMLIGDLYSDIFPDLTGKIQKYLLDDDDDYCSYLKIADKDINNMFKIKL